MARARNSVAAWIGCASALAMAAAGCGTTPSTATDDPKAVAAALRAVHTARCPTAPPAREASDVSGDGLEPLAANRLLLCGYPTRQAEGTEQTVAQAVVTDRTTLDHFRTALNMLDGPPSNPVNCPAETGAKVLEVFTDGVHEVELVQGMTGCQTVTNGDSVGWVSTSASGLGLTVMKLLPVTFCAAVWQSPKSCGFG